MRVLLCILGFAGVLASEVAAQSPIPVLPPDEESADRVLRIEVDQMVREGRLEEAITALETEQEEGPLDEGLRRRLARLYRDTERFQELIDLLEDDRNDETATADLKLLAEAYLALERLEDGLEVLRGIVDRQNSAPSFVSLAANVLSHYGYVPDAIEMLKRGRKDLGSDTEFAQHLGLLYLEMANWDAASTEFLQVIVENPANVGLMRSQLMELAASDEAATKILANAESVYDKHPEVPQLGLVVAELRQRAGDPDAAWEVLEPLLENPDLLAEIVQMAMAGLADSRLPDADPRQSLDTLQLAARTLRGLLNKDLLSRNLQQRAYDTLNRTLLRILENRHFTSLPPDEQADVLSEAREVIVAMGAEFPNSGVTSSALLRLAGIYVDVLGRPADAIQLYELLQVNPNAPREQILLAKLGLGRAYMASEDTLQARTLFTSMGKDPNFRAGQGRAHYYLGMLDFMGGDFETAQERLSSVALDSPTADYTNDSLDLALVLAEQLLSMEPDQEGLAVYGRALYFRETHQQQKQRVELEALSKKSWGGLRDRAYLDLARLDLEGGNTTGALTRLNALITAAPLGRYTGVALELQGDVHLDLGDPALARASYEMLLMEHENYVFVDKVRDKLRMLPAEDESGDLP